MSVAHPFIPLFKEKRVLHPGPLGIAYPAASSYLSMLVPAAHAGQVTVAWDPNPEPDVVGYKIYYGTSPGSYTASVRCGQHDEPR